MKQFNLEEYLANPSRKVITRDGRDVRIICTDRKSTYPIVALIKEREDLEQPAVYCTDGSLREGSQLDGDLFFTPVKKKGKVFLYRDDRGNIYSDTVVLDEHSDYAVGGDNFVAVADIEWEE